MFSLCVYNGELYAGGNFTTADGDSAKYIAKWATITNILAFSVKVSDV